MTLWFILLPVLLALTAIVHVLLRSMERRERAADSTRRPPWLVKALVEWTRCILATASAAYLVLLVLLVMSLATGTEDLVHAGERLLQRAGSLSELVDRLDVWSSTILSAVAAVGLFATFAWANWRRARALEGATAQLKELNDLLELEARHVDAGTSSDSDLLAHLRDRIAQVETRVKSSRLYLERERTPVGRVARMLGLRASGPFVWMHSALGSVALGLFFLSLVALEPGIAAGAVLLRAVELRTAAAADGAEPEATDNHLPRREPPATAADSAAEANELDTAARAIAADVVDSLAHTDSVELPSRLSDLADSVHRHVRPPAFHLATYREPLASRPPDVPYPFDGGRWPGGGGPREPASPRGPPGDGRVVPRAPLEEQVYRELDERIRRQPELRSALRYVRADRARQGSKAAENAPGMHEIAESFSEDVIAATTSHLEDFLARVSGNRLVGKMGSDALASIGGQAAGKFLHRVVVRRLATAQREYASEWNRYVNSRRVIAGKHGCPITQRAFDDERVHGANPLRLYTDDVETQAWLADHGVRGAFQPPIVVERGEPVAVEKLRITDDELPLYQLIHKPCLIMLP